MENKLNGFNNGRDTTDGIGNKEPFTIYEHPINKKPDAYVVGIDPYDVPKTLQNKVFEALGEVSMCWSETPKGVFDSSRAEKIGNKLMKEIKSDIPNAVEVLCNALREDTTEGSYYYSWQANIAMSIYDSFTGSEVEFIGEKNLLDICNKGAKRFLELLIKQ